MATLLKFEDVYGMYSIFKVLNNISINVPRYMFGVSDSCFVHRGCGLGSMFRLSHKTLDSYKYSGIDRIVFVFDADNQSGDKLDVLSRDWLLHSVDDFIKNIKKSGYE